jgi:hypothetical protein
VCVCVCSLTLQTRFGAGDEGHKRQQWRLTEHGHLQCQAGEFCIDIDGKNPGKGAKVIMWTMKLPSPAYPEATHQMWVYEHGQITSKMHGKVLRVAFNDMRMQGGGGAGMGVEVGTPYVVEECRPSAAGLLWSQSWSFE